jgi:hypothetical protein
MKNSLAFGDFWYFSIAPLMENIAIQNIKKDPKVDMRDD